MTAITPQTAAAGARPRRSCLYMPGTNARAHDKARGLAADVLIFDLEDSVAPDAKDEARARVAAAISGGGYGDRELVVRINGLDTPWGAEDLRAAARCAAAVLVPKVSTADQLHAVGTVLDAEGSGAAVWAMMETARGILAAEDIAAAHGRVALFAMGLEDLARELHADNEPPRTAMLYALERVVLVARAHRLGVLDAVYRNFTDAEGFEADCRRGRALGFDGKQLIHPSQVAIANDAFAPDAAAVDQARRLIAAFEAARARGEGLCVLDGQMVEALHVDVARSLVAQAEAIAARESSSR